MRWDAMLWDGDSPSRETVKPPLLETVEQAIKEGRIKFSRRSSEESKNGFFYYQSEKISEKLKRRMLRCNFIGSILLKV